MISEFNELEELEKKFEEVKNERDVLIKKIQEIRTSLDLKTDQYLDLSRQIEERKLKLMVYQNFTSKKLSIYNSLDEFIEQGWNALKEEIKKDGDPISEYYFNKCNAHSFIAKTGVDLSPLLYGIADYWISYLEEISTDGYDDFGDKLKYLREEKE